jgi:uncharacterized protein YqeY
MKETMQSDLTVAIKARDEVSSSTLRMVLTALTNEEVSGKEARVLDEAEVIQVLSREAKKRRESAQAFADANRSDRAERENAEGEVIARYLPTPLSETELASLIAEAIKESGAAGPAGMGLVMKLLSPKIAGRADGAAVSSAVRAALA